MSDPPSSIIDSTESLPRSCSATTTPRHSAIYQRRPSNVTMQLPRTRSVSLSYPSSLSAEALRHKRSFGAVGELIRFDTDNQKRNKRRDHPFAFACWLLHLALVVSIGFMLLYAIYVVTFSKFYGSSFGPQPILSRHHDKSQPSGISRQALKLESKFPFSSASTLPGNLTINDSLIDSRHPGLKKDVEDDSSIGGISQTEYNEVDVDEMKFGLGNNDETERRNLEGIVIEVIDDEGVVMGEQRSDL